MDFSITALRTAPDVIEFGTLLREYYDEVTARIVDAGGPPVDPKEMIQEFWEGIDAYLPPAGRLLVARDSTGKLMGTGALRQIDGQKAELKRLFVRPGGRRMGLGRRLVTRRIEMARELGIKTLLVDTVIGNTPMITLYRSLGFEVVERYKESASANNYPQILDFMVFLRRDL